MRLLLMLKLWPRLSFNPRICKRCDPNIPAYSGHHNVSIHASVKDATFWRWGRRFCRLVSIHASVKDATAKVLSNILRIYRFNPRICKRCDFKTYRPSYGVPVSIHASVKDATSFYAYDVPYPDVSIHASVKDATRPCLIWAISQRCFNPRICKRCDL